MNEKFTLFREKYLKIIYKNYQITNEDDSLKIEYLFEIPGLCSFNPYIKILKDNIKNPNINKDLLNAIAFRLGLVELISYYKCVCPKTIEIEAGFIDDYEKKWFKKLFYNGLGEFFYVNKINVSEDELFDFSIKGERIELDNIEYHGIGNLIPIGGGKDSIVSLELLTNYDNKCVTINPTEVDYGCVGNTELYPIKRVVDKKIVELNNEGYLNGHTPYSAIVAFISYLVAYLTNRKYIVLSNEGSANEPTVIGTNINHQYSKSYEFEKDFDEYTKKYFKIDINYFSLLRPIKEIQIAYIFSKLKKYHTIFRSCNIGSKSNPWIWCNNCPKCLFVFIILRAFLPLSEMIQIFGKNLLDDKNLETYFLELIGEKETKPFECVGTILEVLYAMNRIIKDDNSYLSRLYKEKYYKDASIDLSKIYYDNNVPEEYLNILKEAINDAQ